MAYNLPVLLNPLVNVVFNCPNPSDSHHKKLFSKLKTEKFILLVPPCDKLLHYSDIVSGTTLIDLCRTYDFVASHVLLLDQDVHSDGSFNVASSQTEFNTLNGRKVVVRSPSTEILTGDGFSLRRRCRIQDVELITNFNDYLSGSENYPLVHIDHPLIGTLIRDIDIPKVLSPDDSDIRENGSKLVRDLTQKSWSSFENILRLHPDWSGILNSYFVRYRNTPLTEGPYEELFHMIIRQVHTKMAGDELFQKIPHLYDLIFDYVELNLYDDVWIRIINYYKNEEIDTEPLNILSVNEMETELYQRNYEDFRLQDVTIMEKNLDLAANSFARLPLTHSHAEKANCLIDTLQSLSKERNLHFNAESLPLTMDADTLISFFVLLVCRTQVRNLKSHLFYLRKFSKDENSIKFGILGYAISTFEAVVCYFDDLKGTEKLQRLENACNEAKKLKSLLSDKTVRKISDLSQYQNHLKFRTAQGESVLSQCVINGKNEILCELLKNYESIFPLEDILEDETVDGSTLLIQALKYDNSEAARVIVEILECSCTEEELRIYINKADKHKRTAAHYLTHEVDILQRIGKYIDWKFRDSGGHTPLFTIFRSYDQQNYEKMMPASFRSAEKWYKSKYEQFEFSDHEDEKGNTLLHIIKNNVSILLEYENIDINCTNKKGMTPLMLYARYNRLDNVRTIVRDSRIVLNNFQHPSFLSTFDYARNPLILRELVCQATKFSPFGLAFVHNLKYEAPSWFFHITLKLISKDDYKTVKLHIKTLQGLFHLLLRLYPATFLPLEKALEDLSNLYKSRVSSIAKLETYHFFSMLTDCFNIIFNEDDSMRRRVSKESRLLSWMNSQNRKMKNSKASEILKKKIEPEEVSIITSFLRFNHNELSAVKLKLTIMKKLLTFMKLKSNDLAEAYRFLSLFGTEYSSKENMHLFEDIEVSSWAFGERATMTCVREVSFLDKCTAKLLDQVEQLLHVEIPEWWKCYGEVLEIHKTYKQKFPNINRPHYDTGIIASFFEGKREKMESRLSSDLAECKQKMKHVGDLISSTHEILAEELNKYMVFKGHFVINGILRNWVKENIIILKGRLAEIHKRAHLRRNDGRTPKLL